MALILEFQRKETIQQTLWHVEEVIQDNQLVGYKVVRFNIERQTTEILDTFTVDVYDNKQTKYQEAWVQAATLVNRANRDVLGLE